MSRILTPFVQQVHIALCDITDIESLLYHSLVVGQRDELHISCLEGIDGNVETIGRRAAPLRRPQELLARWHP